MAAWQPGLLSTASPRGVRYGLPEPLVSVTLARSANNDTMASVAKVEKIIEQMRNAPQNVRYSDLAKVCEEHFGAPRQQGTSHSVYKMPWVGDPRVNIQSAKNGMAKAYQVRQVLEAIDKLADDEGEERDSETKDEADE